MTTQLSTLATTSYVDSSVNTSYLQSYSVGTSSISAAITSNNTLYVLPLFSSYLTSALASTLIASMINSNNTVYIANLLSSTLTSQNTIRDTAISTAISTAKSTFLSTVNTYTANQIFPSITVTAISYIGSFNSITIGQFCSGGVNSVAIGYGCLTNSSGVAIGSNSMISTTTGINNTCLGSNNLTYLTSGSSNVSIGQGSATNNITGNNNCFIGAQSNCTGQYNNSCCIGYNSSITGSNQIVLGTSSETVYCNKLSAPNNQILSYLSIPSTVSNQVGYQISSSKTTSLYFSSGDTYISISNITLPVGIYMITYNINIYSSTLTSGVVEKSFIEYGISTLSTLNNIQNRKSYFSIPTSLSHSLTNTYCYVCTGLTIYLNANLPALDLTNNSLTVSRFYVNNCNITCTRIA